MNAANTPAVTPVVTPFDPAEYLDSEAMISAYLTQVLADGDADELLAAIGHVARARGMTKIAQDAGLGRESLYKAFSQGAKPRFETVLKVLRALGVRLQALPIAAH